MTFTQSGAKHFFLRFAFFLGVSLAVAGAVHSAQQTSKVEPVTIQGNTTIYINSGVISGSGIPAQSQVNLTPSTQVQRVDGAINVSAPNKSGPVCGGFVNNRLQDRCAAQPAKFEAAAVGTCPRGSFFDIGTWECWSCPAGYNRTAEGVSTSRACSKPDTSIKGEFTAATFQGPLCPAGSFYDPAREGECWSCPTGYKRSAAAVGAKNACVIAAKEEFRPIDRHSRATGLLKTDCPRGQFWDASDGYCYSCPSNYNRTGYPVRDAKACSRLIKESVSVATVVQKAECRPGEIRDLKVSGTQSMAAGGGCWTCPSTYARTVFPIDGRQACERGGGLTFKEATSKGALTCPADQIFDLTGLTSADISKMRLTGVQPVKSGTCWSCPPGYKRTMASVKGDKACVANTIGWYSQAFAEPGLFGLKGAGTVLQEIVKNNPGLVQDALKAVAKKAAADDRTRSEAQVLAREKQIFATAPHQSTAVAGVVLTRMLAAIAEPAKATSAEKELVESFRNYVIAKRSWIADDAMAAYQAWKIADQKWRERDRASRPQGMQTLIDYGTVPPDFSTLAILNTMAVSAGSTTLGIAAGSLPLVGDVLGVALGAAGNGFADFNNIDTAGRFAAKTSVEVAVGKAVELALTKFAKATATKLTTEFSKIVGATIAKEVATHTLSVAGSAGPQIIISVSLMVGQMALEQMIEIANAEPKLRTAQATARRDPDLKRMVQTAEGIGEIMGLWSFAIAGPAVPAAAYLASYTPVANTALTATATSTAAKSSDTAAQKTVAAPATARAKAAATAPAAAAPATAGADTFSILNTFAGRQCLGVRSGKPVAGAALVIEACSKSVDQSWTMDDRTGQLMLAQGGLCLDVQGNAATLAACANKPQQSWSLGTDGKITNKANGQCLDLVGRRPAAGTAVVLQNCQAAPSQVWTGG